YALPVEREFEVLFLGAPPEVAREGMEMQISKDDLDVSYLDEHRGLDVDQMAAEQVYLEIPMKPLCAPDCRGICASCGSSLNHEPCRCALTA
ncbi:MAG TPA: DUF177 domain-containing protein, partial [Candidatus Polarisedimenticolia bacterium]|nr:DUF177 domain-containing protein [Candidatus Polarisedimenticolia bacterium]